MREPGIVSPVRICLLGESLAEKRKHYTLDCMTLMCALVWRSFGADRRPNGGMRAKCWTAVGLLVGARVRGMAAPAWLAAPCLAWAAYPPDPRL